MSEITSIGTEIGRCGGLRFMVYTQLIGSVKATNHDPIESFAFASARKHAIRSDPSSPTGEYLDNVIMPAYAAYAAYDMSTVVVYCYDIAAVSR